MATTTQHAPGTFCWAELGTTDTAAGKKFYSGLFGWDVQESPIGEGQVYIMLKKGNQDAGAMYALDAQQRKMGIPPHWMNYVSVENADQTAAKIKQMGGKVVMEPFDVMEHGRMAVCQDPQGATFSIWQPKKHPGFGVIDEPGSLCWVELVTTDTDAAEKFYTGVVPWKSEAWPGPTPYTVFKNAVKMTAGMMTIRKEWGPMPPSWIAYFAVEDCDKTLAKATELGGKVCVPAMDIPNVGRMGWLQDPTGGFFAVIAMSPMK
jgi:hypothetical protein